MALVVGLGLTAAFLLFIAGWRMARTDALADWDVADIALLRDENRRKRQVGPLDRLARRLSPQAATLIGPQRVQWIRHQIDLAGRPDGMTVDTFLQMWIKWFLILAPLSVLLLLQGNLFLFVLSLAAPPIMPFSRIAGHKRRRRDQIDVDLPDFLDVLAVTVGSGIGFRSALERVATRFDGPLRDELTFTLHQLDVGVPRRTAFTNLRERTESEAMDSFVTAFLQAEELGAPLAESLRDIALDSRREASQRARQRAGRVVPRVTLLVSIAMVPPTILVIGVGIFLGSDINIGQILNG